MAKAAKVQSEAFYKLVKSNAALANSVADLTKSNKMMAHDLN